jgi:hypothetical protein
MSRPLHGPHAQAGRHLLGAARVRHLASSREVNAQTIEKASVFPKTRQIAQTLRVAMARPAA